MASQSGSQRRTESLPPPESHGHIRGPQEVVVGLAAAFGFQYFNYFREFGEAWSPRR
ncbi:MAG: hypothetical protein OEQ18_15845 [Gammaproteobacteria bacterium]|nr:hypothetical protein [Gammaproteobacteria bacterium]